MTKARSFPVVAALVIALTLLNTYFILRGKHENSQRAGETRTLALANCHGIGALARIERAFIDRQEKQTQVLLKSGITFGIPRSQLPKLIAASKKSQATFLNDLTVLTMQTCAGEEPMPVPVVKPHRVKTKKHVHSTVATPTVTGVTGAVKAGRVVIRKATPRTLPVPRPTRTVTTTTTAPSRAQEAPPTEHTSTTPTTPVTPTTPARPEPERRPVIPPVPCVRVAGVTLC